MIDIKDSHNCCGCSACVQICPKQCISFVEDMKGFKYPTVDRVDCVNCGSCEKVCPCLNKGTSHKPINVYAVTNPNLEVRMKSSSGGFFSMLAEYVINKGGVVFGACFNEDWVLIHDSADTLDGIVKFRGSKYVQSYIGDCYIRARGFLNQGRYVLFSGTSCQIAGLKLFLRKEYERLICVDVVCHGVPSPKVWRDYIETIIRRPKGVAGKNTVLSSLKDTPVLTGISFRDKSTGWKKYGFVAYKKSAIKADENSVLSPNSSNDDILIHEIHGDNLYMKIFLNNLNLRPSCYKCPSKAGRCRSDFTIADFWGIDEFDEKLDDDKGVSAVLVNNSKAFMIISELDVELFEFDYSQVYKRNHSIENSVKEQKYSKEFWTIYQNSGIEACDEIIRKIKPPFTARIYSSFIRIMKRIRIR